MSDDDILTSIHALTFDAEVRVADERKREIDVRLVPWGRIIETENGPETVERGAFADVDPSTVRLWGMEHEVHLGIGQRGQPTVTRHATGKAVRIWETDDGAYATFKVARTARGDEVLALAEEGIADGVSVEIKERPGGTTVETRAGRRTRVHRKLTLTGASTTYRPAYGNDPGGSIVLAVRTAAEGGDVPETQTETANAGLDTDALASTIATAVGTAVETAMTRTAGASDEAMQRYLDRLEALEENARTQITFPVKQDAKPYPDDFARGDWAKMVLRGLSGDTIPTAELQARVAADLITSDNLGVIPTAYVDEIIGIIDPARPFLQSTRRLNTPRSGMQLSLPKIVTRPTTGVQAEEKDELASTATSIVPATFDPTTVGGYGDISLQLLKRSDPSYLELYLDLLAEAYAIDADDLAVDALLAESSVVEGGAVNPDEGAQFGSAWANAAAVSRLLVPDTLWLSSAAVAAFIDAKSDTTNSPLYANLAANFTAGGGTGGTISGLRPVHVPALDDEAVDMIVGPSRGFAWTEDGTYTLQVDVPAKAGRDVGIVGILWFAPLYPAAFTTYTLGS